MKNIKFAIEEITKKPFWAILTMLQLVISFILIFFGIATNNSVIEKDNYLKKLFGDKDYYVIDTKLTKDLSEIDLEDLVDFNNYLESEGIKRYLSQTDSVFISNNNLKDEFLANFDKVVVDNKNFQRVYIAYVNDTYIKDIGLELSEGELLSSDCTNIPIVVGESYKNILSLHDKIPYIYTKEDGEKVIKFFEITGFLKKGSYICNKGNPNAITIMDNYIVMSRGINTRINNSDKEMVKKINLYNYCTNAYFNFENLDKMKKIEDKSMELGVSFRFKNISKIFDEFKKDFDLTMINVKIFAISILFFTVISIVISMVNMIIKLKKQFAINMIVGASIKDIILRVFYEIAMLFTMSIILSIFIIIFFLKDSVMLKFNSINIIELVILAIIVCLFVSIIPILKFKKFSLNSILRGSE